MSCFARGSYSAALVSACFAVSVAGQETARARDLGVPFEGTPGPLNAITDVAGVTTGHVTLVEGEGALRVGSGPIRTGVTAILPRGKVFEPVFAGWYSLNGNGEMTGTTWIEESGDLGFEPLDREHAEFFERYRANNRERYRAKRKKLMDSVRKAVEKAAESCSTD